MASKNTLVKKEEYLTAGIHIGMKTCTPYMKQFVYKIREDGLSVFDLSKVDERLKVAAKFLSNYNNILVVSRKDSASKPIQAFSENVGGKAISGRFSPGTLTNPSYREFFEPDIVVVVDPLIDSQAVTEAKRKRVPIISFCDTFNMAKGIDLCIPINNNGRKSLSLAFFIIAREILKAQGKIKTSKEFDKKRPDFGLDEEKPKVKSKTLASEILEAAKKEAEEKIDARMKKIQKSIEEKSEKEAKDSVKPKKEKKEAKPKEVERDKGEKSA